MYSVSYHKQFKKDIKLALKRGFKKDDIDYVINKLRSGEKLPDKYRDHELTISRKYKAFRECHINPDWLLVYRINKDILELELFRTGTHSDLF